MFEKLKKWINSTWICKICGQEYSTSCFGFGECICLNCHDGEQPLLYPDKSYWLNRLVARAL